MANGDIVFEFTYKSPHFCYSLS